MQTRMRDDPVFAERRARVMQQLGASAALVVAASPEIRVGADAELKYVIDPDLYYLTGHTEPDAVAVLCPSHEAPFTLFVRPRDADRERWTGARGGVEAATAVFGADAAHASSELAGRLPALLAGIDTVYARLAYGRPDVDAAVLETIGRGRRERVRSGRGPHAVVDPGVVLDDMRLIKDATEIARIRQAADTSVEVFREATGVIGDGAGEWQIEATIDGGFRVRGAAGPAFPTIVASGPNAGVLHHIANDRTMRTGELVLIDAGARQAMYCADMSRTFPVSGRYSPEQRALYDVVLAAHDAAIAAVRPGATIEDVHRAALRVLATGLIDMRFLTGSVDEHIESGDGVRTFFPHKTSHWLGIDVHDVGTYVVDGNPRVLAAGMVLTIEPGLYIGQDAAAPSELRGIGVRIEDDILVTESGHENLTHATPKSVAEIEKLVAA